ncbi:MAG: hypothetical protein Q7R76_01105 [Candidatus Woesearchaeota archaeon]|nr:hypothetical protein [Candidatus Woesearchaeota archaeon]
MLDEPRIKEAEKNVRAYIEDGLLKKQSFQEPIYTILRRNAKDSLEIAGFLLQNKKSDLWIIVTSYYAMYYSANAVLYKLGYKIGEKISHKITADALIVFVRNKLKKSLLEEYEKAQQEALAGIKTDALIETFDFERKKRSDVQYEMKEAELHGKATTSLNRAKEFMLEMEKLL